MDKRRYVQTRRARRVGGHPARILEAAREPPSSAVRSARCKVDEVAREAGVARSTVYLLFGSRAGLFDALGPLPARRGRVRRARRRVPAARRARQPARRRSAPRSRCTRSCPTSPGPVHARAPSTRTRVAAVARHRGRPPAGHGGAWPGRSPSRATCATDVTVEEAVDILTVITSFQAFDELFTGSGLPADVVADRLIAMAERSVCRPGI